MKEMHVLSQASSTGYGSNDSSDEDAAGSRKKPSTIPAPPPPPPPDFTPSNSVAKRSPKPRPNNASQMYATSKCCLKLYCFFFNLLCQLFFRLCGTDSLYVLNTYGSC